MGAKDRGLQGGQSFVGVTERHGRAIEGRGLEGARGLEGDKRQEEEGRGLEKGDDRGS